MGSEAKVVDVREYHRLKMKERLLQSILRRGDPPVVPSEVDQRLVEEGNWYRADGSCVCPSCDDEYQYHPAVEGYDWLNRLCTGDLVKL